MYATNSTGGLMLQTMLYLANQTSRAAVNTLVDFPPAPKSDINEVRCYGVYGCFPLNGPWTTVTRQINVHPQKPEEIEPHFTLYTTHAFNDPKFLNLNDPESVRNMKINPMGKIFFISHGYLESGAMEWMHELGKELITSEPEGEVAVVLIDWGGGSSPPYVQAVANIRLVGAITAHVIYMLYEELGLVDLSNFHIIGHSLGAHLAGYAGHTLQKDFGLKVQRITGLDPAAPLFSETERIVRLDRSDAHFVDIIHTDANPLMKGGLGIFQRIGHIDFFPNGGFDNPGCDMRLQDYMKNRKSSLLSNMQQFLGCNHIRSYQYFTESIKSKCPFMGITCNSYESFKEGKCSHCGAKDHHLCMRMGYWSYEDYQALKEAGKIHEHKPPVLYLLTGDSKPYCRLHYKVTVHVSSHEESTTHGGEIGTLSINLHEHKNKKSTDRMNFSDKPTYFEPGYIYTSMLAGKPVHNPAYATVHWDYQTNILNPLTWRIISSPRIFLDKIQVESMESSRTHLKLCPLDESPVISGSENVMQTRYCK